MCARAPARQHERSLQQRPNFNFPILLIFSRTNKRHQAADVIAMALPARKQVKEEDKDEDEKRVRQKIKEQKQSKDERTNERKKKKIGVQTK